MSAPTLIKRPYAFGWIVQVVSDQRKGIEAFYSRSEDEAQAVEWAWKAWGLAAAKSALRLGNS